jgi:hypothetical protein
MTPSRPIDNRSGRHHSRWFVISNAPARQAARDSKPRIAPILSPTVQSATAPLRLHQRLATTQSLHRGRVTLLLSQAAAKSP